MFFYDFAWQSTLAGYVPKKAARALWRARRYPCLVTRTQPSSRCLPFALQLIYLRCFRSWLFRYCRNYPGPGCPSSKQVDGRGENAGNEAKLFAVSWLGELRGRGRRGESGHERRHPLTISPLRPDRYPGGRDQHRVSKHARSIGAAGDAEKRAD